MPFLPLIPCLLSTGIVPISCCDMLLPIVCSYIVKLVGFDERGTADFRCARLALAVLGGYFTALDARLEWLTRIAYTDLRLPDVLESLSSRMDVFVFSSIPTYCMLPRRTPAPWLTVCGIVLQIWLAVPGLSLCFSLTAERLSLRWIYIPLGCYLRPTCSNESVSLPRSLLLQPPTTMFVLLIVQSISSAIAPGIKCLYLFAALLVGLCSILLRS